MLCSNCSEPVKPIATFDIDGTMGKYHEHFLNFACLYLGWGNNVLWDRECPYDGRQPFRGWFCDTFKVDVRTFRDIKLAYRQGAQKRSMPINPWARIVVQAARMAGAEIWVTTTRPYMRLDNVDPDTRFWLQRYGIKFDYLIYGDYKYEELAKQVNPERVCVVLDDLVDQIDIARRFFRDDACLLYKTSWNSAYHAYPGFDDPDDILRAVTYRIERWKNEHS